MKNKNQKKRLSSSRIIIIGFLAAISIGTVLLALPMASVDGRSVGFLNALFTATSATCVTGMTVLDTATAWSFFGKAVILILMQIGGMGVVTFSVTIAMVSGRKIGLMQRTTMAETAASTSVGGMVRLTGFIVKVTFAFEFIGAILLTPVFAKHVGVVKGFAYGLFHSVSAFCNAGFDLMGGVGKGMTMEAYADNHYFNVILMILIVVGGIGFLVWDDIRNNGLKYRHYRMQTKIVLYVSAFLLLISFIYFYTGEYAGTSFEDVSGGKKVMRALFQTVTLRSAGFAEVDPSLYSEPGKLIMIMFMMIGGSPGSTAGGMKTTTIAVLIAAGMSVFSRKEDVSFFGRRIHDDVIKYAATIFMMYTILFVTGGILLCIIEGFPILTCLFESAAAISTAGISLGITSKLCAVSKIIIIMLMFLGRAGGLTVVFAALAGEKKGLSRLPMEKLTVG